MIKIAIFCDTPKTISGIVRYCNLLKDLLETYGDFKVSVFSNIPYKRIANVFNIYDKKSIKKALLSEDFDIIHINGFISTIPYFVYSAIKSLMLRVSIVYTPHAHPFYTLAHPVRNRFFFNIFVKKILKKADYLISINNEDYKFFRKFNNNVITIPHWTIKEIPKKQKDKYIKPIILFVGRNDSNKNLRELYSLPKDKYKIICVTNIKPDRDDFEFKEGVTDEELISLYSNASLTVVPSKYEAFSYTAMESLLAGTPILVSDRVRIFDFLEGVTGVMQYKFQDKNDFLAKIDEIINQKVDVEKVEDIFSKQKAFEKYNHIYTMLVMQKEGNN